jgi:hypothetical protein
MIDWLLFFKTNKNFSQVDIIFKRGNSDKIYMRINEIIDSKNMREIENTIINLINLYVPVREHVYIVLDHKNISQYQLEKMMPKLSSRVHQVIYANVT